MSVECLISQTPSLCDVLSAMQKDVDYLLIAKPVAQLTTRGSAATVQSLLLMCRLLVVLIEDGDPCPLDWEILSETCEIGEQGACFAGRY